MTAYHLLVLAYSAIQCCNACLKVEFIVDNVIVDKISNSAAQSTLSGITTDEECGIKCVQATGCLSFFYNEAEGNCRLHSTMFKPSESSLEAAPGYTYRKPFCPQIAKDIVPKGKTGVSYEGGVMVARVTCKSDAIFIGTSETVKCDADGFWPQMGSCALTRWSHPTVPFSEAIPFTTKAGTAIDIIGRSFGKELQMEIGAGSDVALYLMASENGLLNRGSIVSGNKKGLITLSTSEFYKPAKEFKCNVKISSTEFTLSVGGKVVFTYVHVVPVESIDKLRFMNGIELKEIHMYQ